ncbi:S-layer homology domain-containing protein [Collinsella tanakaei]|nr:S-layer homology domain-containing protein [Collinsella tanakaei]
MTACVNRKHTKKVAAVVTASLVGALSLGAAPVAAVADTGIETLAATPQQDIDGASLTAAENGKGQGVEIPEKGVITFEAGKGEYLVPTQLTPEFGGAIDLDYAGLGMNANCVYYSGYDASGTPVDPETTALGEGKYSVKVTISDADSKYNGCTKVINFRIVGNKLDGATIFNANKGNSDTTKTGFTYSAAGQTIGVALDGVVLSASEYDLYYVVDGGDISTAAPLTDGIKLDAGKYLALVCEEGGSSSDPIEQIPFTVDQLDLADAGMAIADVAMTDPKPTACTDANGNSYTSGNWVNIAISGGAWGTKGEFTATISVNSGNANAKKNLKGTATVKFNAIDGTVLTAADFEYDGNDFMTALDGKTFDLSKGQRVDLSKVTVINGTDELDTDLYDVWVTDEDGNTVDDSSVSTPGTWHVNARVNAAANEHELGSCTVTATVNVTAGEVASDDYAFLYKGEVTGNLNLVYNGSDVLDDLETVVKVDGKTLVEGEDYTVEVKKGTQVVDSIVDAGDYTVTIKSDKYDIADALAGGNSIDVKITPLVLTNRVYASSELMQDFGGNKVIPYTGEAIDADFEFGYYTDKDGNQATLTATNADELTWNALPEGTVVIRSIDYYEDGVGRPVTDEDTDEILETGDYILNLRLGDDVINYSLASHVGMPIVTVSDKGVYYDVPNNEWFSEPVYSAKKLGYMSGYDSTQLFGPNDSLTRGQAACVLYNMATSTGSGSADDVTDGTYNEYIGYATKFSDVDIHAYYAAAVGWASKTGVVNGYGDGTFAPNENITREEFAAMLSNYAKALGKFEAAPEGALDSFADAGQVSDWATESVAWAVANKVMGNNGSINATSDITRAEVAAMAVNYQPENLSSSDLLR